MSKAQLVISSLAQGKEWTKVGFRKVVDVFKTNPDARKRITDASGQVSESGIFNWIRNNKVAALLLLAEVPGIGEIIADVLFDEKAVPEDPREAKSAIQQFLQLAEWKPEPAQSFDDAVMGVNFTTDIDDIKLLREAAAKLGMSLSSLLALKKALAIPESMYVKAQTFASVTRGM